MTFRLVIAVAALISLSTVASTSLAQQGPARSHSSGIFVGLGLEGDGVSTHVAQSDIWTKTAGGGAGLVIGYGFTPRWSLYSDLSVATIDQSQAQTGSGPYSLRHVDAGVRVHFRTGNTVVPFAQFGFSGRSMTERFPQYTGNTLTSFVAVESRSSGVGFGGGLNAHFNPAFAFSGSVAWTLGEFTPYKQNGQRVGGASWNATSARVNLGIIWFPRA